MTTNQTIVIDDCRHYLSSMEDESIDMVITSPPYYAVRDYNSELGCESTPEEYIENLVKIFDEVKRILRPTGSCWVNLADRYISKNLMQIPNRFAISMCNNGWILRNEIIWHKPNVIPSNVKNRFTIDFEKLFFFTKCQDYYFKQVKEEMKLPTAKSSFGKRKNGNGNDQYSGHKYDATKLNGRNARTVWSISTKVKSYNHCAMFPIDIVDKPIRACCPPDGIVLDPFCGSGTTLEYCSKHGIRGIGVEINPVYEEIIRRRVKE